MHSRQVREGQGSLPIKVYPVNCMGTMKITIICLTSILFSNTCHWLKCRYVGGKQALIETCAPPTQPVAFYNYHVDRVALPKRCFPKRKQRARLASARQLRQYGLRPSAPFLNPAEPDTQQALASMLIPHRVQSPSLGS